MPIESFYWIAILMDFDQEEHKIRQKAIRAAKEFRVANGMPVEKNITILYKEGTNLLGISITTLDSKQANHLPAPYEVKDKKTGKFVAPRKDCPKCGKKDLVVLDNLCHNCTESEGGKYKSVWRCLDNKCGYREVSPRSYPNWLDELVPDWQSGMKRDMGIQTMTDEGLK